MNDRSFPYRVAAGVAIFAVLLAYDLWKNRGQSRRLKEYSFLFGATVFAMVYGVMHDFVTWHICRDYYVIGKGIPSASHGYTMDVVKLAMKATWTAGLIVAAVLLVANNPDRQGRQLPYRVLVRLALIPLGVSIAIESLLGVVFSVYAQPLARIAHMMTYYEVAGPRFLTVWGMHVGAYAGAAIGLVAAVIAVVRMKKQQSAA